MEHPKFQLRKRAYLLNEKRFTSLLRSDVLFQFGTRVNLDYLRRGIKRADGMGCRFGKGLGPEMGRGQGGSGITAGQVSPASSAEPPRSASRQRIRLARLPGASRTGSPRLDY